jgi:Protein of unknown function (DUF3105)
MSVPTTKREKRLAAREERKQRAQRARKQAKIRQLVLLGVLAVALVALGYYAVTSNFFGFAAPTVGRAMPVERAEHVPAGTPIEYSTRPPTSGKHYDAWHPTYGVVEEAVPAGNWVHNLEHGAIVLLYNCPQGCPELVQRIKEFHATLPAGRNARRGVARLLAVPYADMDHRIAVVAWGWLLELDEFDAEKIRQFYDARIDRGPECVNLNCPD